MAAHRKPDRQEMFQAYVAMGDSRSHVRVAEMFGISKVSVTAIAVKYEWMKRLRDIDEEVRREADKKLMAARVEAHERHLKLAKLIQSKGVQGLQEHRFDNARDSAKAVVEGVKLERTSLGEPNDHHTLSVQQLTKREVDMLLTGPLFPEDEAEEEEDQKEEEQHSDACVDQEGREPKDAEG